MDAADDDPEQPQLRRHSIASPDRSADIPILSSFLSSLSLAFPSR
jgi:hypothetical protein